MQGVPKPLIDERVMAGGLLISNKLLLYYKKKKSGCLLAKGEIRAIAIIDNLIKKRKGSCKKGNESDKTSCRGFYG